MIRLRKPDGSVTEVDTANAVEMIDAQGRLAVVTIQRSSGQVQILTPGDPVFNAYCRTQKLSPSKVTVHEPVEGKPLPTG